jgi:mannosyltransferase OCH1-like enzyme
MYKNVKKLKHHFENENNKVWIYNEESARKEIEDTIAKYDDDEEDDRDRDFYKAILVVYDALFAKAFKYDLFRYFILFEKGGIYLDIKFYPVNGFDLTKFVGSKNELYVKNGKRLVCNAFMICKRKSCFMRKALQKLLKNAYEGFKGPNALCPTGPLMLGEILKSTAFTEEYMPYEEIQQDIYDRSGKRLIETYPEYRKEQDNSGIRDETDYTYAWIKGTHINAFALEPLRKLKTRTPNIF